MPTHRERGGAFFKAQEYEKALECYRAALSSASVPDAATTTDRIALLCNESLTCLKLQRFEEACYAALKACNLDFRRPKSLFRLASALLEVGLAYTAAEVADVGLALARCHGGDTVELTALMQRAISAQNGKEPEDANSKRLRDGVAEMLGQCRQYLSDSGTNAQEPRAKGQVDGMGRSDADASEVAKQAATVAYKSGDYQLAVNLYSDALTHDPKNKAALGSRCATYLMLRRYADAKVDAEAILATDPSDARACSRLAKALLGCQDPDSALHWAQKAAALAPDSAQLRSEVSRLLRLQSALGAAREAIASKNTAAAMLEAQRADSLAQGTPLAAVQVVLAEAHLLSGNINAALEASRSALRAEKSTTTMAVHARVLVMTGNISRALSMYQQLNREDPDNATFGKTLKRLRALSNGRETGNTAFKEGRFEQAFEAYSRSIVAADDLGVQNTFVAQVATNRANVCLKLGRPRDAVVDAEVAIAADGDFAKAYLRRAQAFEKLGKWAEAVQDYNRVQQLDKSLAGVDEMLRNAKVELKKANRVDYYKLLDISRDAGDAEVKKAYKRAALKCHPDKVPAEEREEAEKRFKLLGEANAVLTDSAKRQRYDAGWSLDEIEQGFQEGAGIPRGGGVPAGMEDVLFQMFMGGGGRGMRGGGFGR